MITPSHLTVRSDLTAETNGVTTTLTGDGSLLRWELVEATTVFAAQPGMQRSELARVAEVLHAHGILLSVEEQGRPLLELGATKSRLGALLFRSSAVKPRAPFRLARIAFRATRR